MVLVMRCHVFFFLSFFFLFICVAVEVNGRTYTIGAHTHIHRCIHKLIKVEVKVEVEVDEVYRYNIYNTCIVVYMSDECKFDVTLDYPPLSPRPRYLISHHITRKPSRYVFVRGGLLSKSNEMKKGIKLLRYHPPKAHPNYSVRKNREEKKKRLRGRERKGKRGMRRGGNTKLKINANQINAANKAF